MNLLRVRLNYGDILTFTMRPWFITVVVRSMLYRHRRLSMTKWLSCNGPRRYTGQTDSYSSQKHYAHTLHAHEGKKQTY